ncbi:MAG: hypothetical protein PHH39_11760, partial [Methanothrix soehngenii]|nr:hypothetical protein [Methanothrix soehngenii]
GKSKVIKLRAWDHWNDEMIYSDKFDDLYDFFYDVKKRENGGNLVSLMLKANYNDTPIFEGDIIKFWHSDKEKTGIVECRPEHFCYWQVKVPGDHFGLGWVMNCCTGMQVIGNRYADREWLEDEGFVGLLDEAEPKNEEPCADEPGVPISRVEALRIAGETLEKAEEERLVKPICIGSEYQDGFGHTIKEGDILSFKLCGRRLTGEVKRIWSNDRYCWQVWTYESPEMKLSLRHMCEDVACTEVRVIGFIYTVRQGGVAVQDIGITI